MEATQLRHGHEAAERGVFVVSAVGFDCVPAEVGAHCCIAALLARGATPHCVHSFLHLTYGPAGASAHFAT